MIRKGMHVLDDSKPRTGKVYRVFKQWGKVSIKWTGGYRTVVNIDSLVMMLNPERLELLNGN